MGRSIAIAPPCCPLPVGTGQQYADYIVNTIAPEYHLEAAVLLWQVQQESGFNPNAYSSAGAIGIAQFMPAMAAAYGIDPWNPWQSLDGMARYDLASLRAFWDESHTHGGALRREPQRLCLAHGPRGLQCGRPEYGSSAELGRPTRVEPRPMDVALVVW